MLGQHAAEEEDLGGPQRLGWEALKKEEEAVGPPRLNHKAAEEEEEEEEDGGGSGRLEKGAAGDHRGSATATVGSTGLG